MRKLILYLTDIYENMDGCHRMKLRLPAESGEHSYADMELLTSEGESVFLRDLSMKKLVIRDVSSGKVTLLIDKVYNWDERDKEVTIDAGDEKTFCWSRKCADFLPDINREIEYTIKYELTVHVGYEEDRECLRTAAAVLEKYGLEASAFELGKFADAFHNDADFTLYTYADGIMSAAETSQDEDSFLKTYYHCAGDLIRRLNALMDKLNNRELYDRYLDIAYAVRNEGIAIKEKYENDREFERKCYDAYGYFTGSGNLTGQYRTPEVSDYGIDADPDFWLNPDNHS